MSGLTPTGFVAKTVQEILTDLQTRQASTIDGSLNPTATGVLANVNASIALELGQLWELAQEIYDAHDPNSAQGIAADHNGALSGITRDDHSKSTVVLTLSLAANTMVNAGSVVSVVGNPSARFVTLEDAMSLGSPITIDVHAEAESYGAVIAGAHTMQQIESPTSGWLSVDNALAADVGADVETDEAYNVRRVLEIASEGGSTTAGILADLRKITTVRTADAIENETDATVDGVPPHSFECIVLSVDSAGDDVAIATSIWSNKPDGIQSWGSTSIAITDSEGVEQTVRFTRPTVVPINGKYHANHDDSYVANSVRASISQAVSDPTNPAHFGVGEDVHLYRLLVAASTTVGLIDLTLDIERDPSVPASAVPSSITKVLAIGSREIASFGSWAEI